MTLIDELSRSVSEMSDDELLNRIKELRTARRTQTTTRRAKANKRTSNATKNLSPEALLNSMSADELDALMKQLEEAS